MELGAAERDDRMKLYPVNRPFTIAEISAMGVLQRSVWIVEFRNLKRLCRVGDYVFRNFLLEKKGDLYGAEWRVWAYRPSNSDRMLVAWREDSLAPSAKELEQEVRALMQPYHQLVKEGRSKYDQKNGGDKH